MSTALLLLALVTRLQSIDVYRVLHREREDSNQSTVLCAANEPCVVSCLWTNESSSCANLSVIDASDASSLSVNCTGAGSCHEVQIECPSDGARCSIQCWNSGVEALRYGGYACSSSEVHVGGSNATIECNGMGDPNDVNDGYCACFEMSIVDDGVNDTQLDVRCNGYFSCSYLSIALTASSSKQALVQCNAWGACPSRLSVANAIEVVDVRCQNLFGGFACGDLKIFADYAKLIRVHCEEQTQAEGKGNCVGLQVYGQYAENISITAMSVCGATGMNGLVRYADNGNWNNGVLNASYAQNVDITCFGRERKRYMNY